MALSIVDKDMNELDNFEPSSTSTFGKFLEWIHSWINTLRKNILNNKSVIEYDRKNSIIFGKYTGNGTASRFIELDFTPVAVEIYTNNGLQGSPNGGGDETYGGFALKGFNCHDDSIKIDTGGFYVAYNFSYNKFTNKNGETYYFKAYRYGVVKQYA